MRLLRSTLLGLTLAAVLPACGGSPVAPIPACEADHTGDLVLVNLSDTLNPRDVYVDGHIVTTLPYGSQTTVVVDAGIVHTVEWVSTLTGASLDVEHVVVDQCSAATLNNHF